MKAFRIYDACDMRQEEVPIPEIGDYEVLIKVIATGICSTDIELYDGSMPYFEQGLSKRPMTAGHEWSGRVAKLGTKVKGFDINDLVVGDISIGCGRCSNCLKGMYHLCDDRTELGVIKYDGAFAEYLKTEGKNLYKVPDSVSPSEAAMVETTATVTHAVQRTTIQPGDSVVVYGDGAIGLINAQVANTCGAGKVYVVGLKDTHKDMLAGWGITFINADDRDPIEAITEANGSLADIVFEDTGNPAALENAIKSVKPGGKLCVLSITGAPTVPVDIDYIVTREITVFGVLASPNCFGPALDLISSGKVDVKSCITHTYPFDKTNEAFDYVKNVKDIERIKVVVLQESNDV